MLYKTYSQIKFLSRTFVENSMRSGPTACSIGMSNGDLIGLMLR